MDAIPAPTSSKLVNETLTGICAGKLTWKSVFRLTQYPKETQVALGTLFKSDLSTAQRDHLHTALRKYARDTTPRWPLRATLVSLWRCLKSRTGTKGPDKFKRIAVHIGAELVDLRKFDLVACLPQETAPELAFCCLTPDQFRRFCEKAPDPKSRAVKLLLIYDPSAECLKASKENAERISEEVYGLGSTSDELEPEFDLPDDLYFSDHLLGLPPVQSNGQEQSEILDRQGNSPPAPHKASHMS